MKYPALIAFAACAASGLFIGNEQQALGEQEQFLIELSPGETRWISEDEKWELKRVCA
jgi:bacterial leucyl aminopeptidase